MPIIRSNKRAHTPFSVRPTTGPKLGVCAYYAPGGTTTDLKQGMISDADRRARYRRIAARPGALVVMNVASGPGASAQPVETKARAEMNQAGITVLGYVSTRDNGTKRPAGDVKKDIDAWVTMYDPDGIFLDEGEPGQTQADLAYYTDLASYVRGKARDLVVAYNPGTHPHAAYYQVMDVIMICEHPAATVLDDSQVPDLDENRAGPAQVWAMAYSASADQARALVAKARRCGWHYLTILDTDPETDWYQTLPPDALLDLPALAAPASSGGGQDTTATTGVVPYVWDGKTTGGTAGTTYIPAAQSTLDSATGWEWEGGTGTISGGVASIPAGAMLTATIDIPTGKSVRIVVEVTGGATAGHAEAGFFDSGWGWINGPGWDPQWSGPGTYASSYFTVPAGAANGTKFKIGNTGGAPMTVTRVQVEEAGTPGKGGRPTATWVEWRSATDPTGLPDFDSAHDTWLPTVVV